MRLDGMLTLTHMEGTVLSLSVYLSVCLVLSSSVSLSVCRVLPYALPYLKNEVFYDCGTLQRHGK